MKTILDIIILELLGKKIKSFENIDGVVQE